MKTRQYFIGILTLFFFACGGEVKLLCKEEELVEAPPEFLRYWYFPKGSWWVYQLQDTVGVYDTMRVVSDYKRYCNRDGASDIDCDQAPCTWMYSNTWEHSNDSYFRVGGGCPEKGTNYFSSYYFGSYWITQSSGRCFPSYVPEYPIKYPFIVGEKYMGNNQILSEETMTIAGEVFPKTIHIIPDYGGVIDTVQAYFVKSIYLCPTVGVIKWQYSHSGTWELIAYDVTP